MKIEDLKIGMKVYSKSRKTWGIITGFKGIKEYDKTRYWCSEKGVTIKVENTYTGWEWLRDLEKFIEPKFKVGKTIVISNLENGNPEVMEIIVSKLNKKLKTYVNMLFSKKDGRVCVLTDEYLFKAMNFANEKFGKKKMKLSEVEELLGYRIEIIK